MVCNSSFSRARVCNASAVDAFFSRRVSHFFLLFFFRKKKCHFILYTIYCFFKAKKSKIVNSTPKWHAVIQWWRWNQKRNANDHLTLSWCNSRITWTCSHCVVRSREKREKREIERKWMRTNMDLTWVYVWMCSSWRANIARSYTHMLTFYLSHVKIRSSLA